ncbi:hypothetical protein ANCCEY_15308, partial [Ancylostoma ceylanicum]
EWVLQKCSGGKVRRWALENGIDEHRMYEISKLRSQYRQVLEDAGLIEKPDAHELGEDDSRQRRIDQGDRKKLLDMKQSLDERADNEGRSVRHQIPFYGLLLETTKPYICNVLPLPALAVLLFAKKVVCDDWKLVMVDDFAEISFSRNQQCEEVMQSVVKIRKQLNE